MNGESTTRRGIALVAHDGRKTDLIAWAGEHRQRLVPHRLVATGSTGQLLRNRVFLEVECVRSGPLGGDQQIGSRIVDGEIDMLVFFWDPLESQPHASDVQALQRLAALSDIPCAYNSATATYLLTSPMFDSEPAAPTSART